jgi:hypothetical protein
MLGGFGDAQKIRSRGERRPCPAGRREVVEVEPTPDTTSMRGV